ncbi:predicted membrane protein [Photobacterium aphoticum]|uniref:Predicted membrane protein n=1 Tax=Photobacterium aphoticum TaxID=754436 RepID=A0A090QI76_9GAMM|nr:predicted membrane protein [Photobacterium aphoticum]
MDTYKPFTALPLFLAALVGSVIVWSGINPAFFEVWVAEIIPVALVYLGLVVTHRRFTFSNTAYVMMSMWLLMHSVGAHYTFANVPFEWFNDLVGSDRNHFDRIAHYSIGFYAFPIAEYMVRKNHAKPVVASLFALFSIMSIAAAYEIIEWWYAVLAGGDAGIEFLGSQGDIWDAQKDMLADTLGAITSLVIFGIIKPYSLPHAAQSRTA